MNRLYLLRFVLDGGARHERLVFAASRNAAEDRIYDRFPDVRFCSARPLFA